MRINAASFLAAGVLLTVLAGCGGGGGGGESGATGAVAFKVVWPAKTGAAGPTAAFPGPIPPSVQSIRLIVDSASSADGSCCVSIRRGSAAFQTRSIVINDLAAGSSTLDFAAFAQLITPDGGVTRACATAPEAEASPCVATEDIPQAFAADQLEFAVLPNQIADAGTVTAYSLPFAIPVEPLRGNTAPGPMPSIELVVVDAIAEVDDDFTVEIETATSSVSVAPSVAIVPCDDDTGQICSAGANLGVKGLRFIGQATEAIDAGPVKVKVHAHNHADPERTVDVRYPIEVDEGAAPVSCDVTFVAPFSETYGALNFEVDYSSAPGSFAGEGEDVECEPLSEAQLHEEFDDSAERVLRIALIDAIGFDGPTDLFKCRFSGTRAPVANDLPITIVQATDPEGVELDTDLAVEIGAIDCGGTPTTTTTTTTSSTVTTSSVTTTSDTTPPSATCAVTFRLISASAGVGALQYSVDYATATGEFRGIGAAVVCANKVTGALPANNDVDATRVLNMGVISLSPFFAPADLAECTFDGSAVDPPVPGDFNITIQDATDGDGTPITVTLGSSIVCQ